MNTSRTPGRGEPGQHAWAIAEAVATAWHQSSHSGRRDVPLSVVAALSLVNRGDQGDPAERFRSLSPAELIDTLRATYRTLIRCRPDLVAPVYPLAEWLLSEPAPGTALQRAAHRTAEAALNAGQLEVTGTEQRYEVDLLGMVLCQLKSHTATSANAQIYTPAAVADTMAHMVIGADINEGDSVHEPTVGTGGLLRSTAQAMRELGRDPATVRWYGADIDDLAIAACAINALVWGLGPHVVLCTADILTEGDWAVRAEKQRAEILDLATTIQRSNRMVAVLEHLTSPESAGPASG